MPAESPFCAATHYHPERVEDYRGTQLPMVFRSPAEDYAATREGLALFDRSDRGLIIVTGGDRKSWLHNLVTNAVSTLDDHAGNYAFMLDVKGRVQFDLNVLSLPEALWLDVDAAIALTARQQLDRYLITEDVQLNVASASFARLACYGPRAADAASALGAANFAALPALSSRWLVAEECLLVRQDLGSAPGFELFIAAGEAPAWWDRLVNTCAAQPAGHAALDVLRIEAGVPWPGRELTERVVAPETGQIERAISYHKGCYLGQEIIERMRAHGSLARRLMRVILADGFGLAPPESIRKDGKEVGWLTSLASHPLAGKWIGLAYVRTGAERSEGLSVGADEQPVTVVGPAGG